MAHSVENVPDPCDDIRRAGCFMPMRATALVNRLEANILARRVDEVDGWSV